jgi:serine phosphatase RsbU (regulator of sigma subunit)
VFGTFAYLAWDGERLQYSLAGHPPILHYHAVTREISELACSNLPLGKFGGEQFVSGSAQCAPDDLFLLLTDGVLEVANNKDEEFWLGWRKDRYFGARRQSAQRDLRGGSGCYKPSWPCG